MIGLEGFLEIIKNALTIVKNNEILPIENLNNKIAYVELGGEKGDTFYEYLTYYADVKKVIYTRPKSSHNLQQRRPWKIRHNKFPKEASFPKEKFFVSESLL